MQPIGYVRGGYSERFGTPRQAGLAPAVSTNIEIVLPFNREEAWRDLNQFSHIWVIFGFHSVRNSDWRPTVRPPRLGGQKRLGVFATRSPHRPNHLGLSAVALDKVCIEGARVTLMISGADVIDGTPVFDIKPYLPYADAVAKAHGAYAGNAPVAALSVCFTTDAAAQCDQFNHVYPGKVPLNEVLAQIIALDPRPAGDRALEKGEYAMRFHSWDVRWRIREKVAEIFELVERG